MLNLKELQKRRDLEIVWVTVVKWSDGSWGAYPEMGCGGTRSNAMSEAKAYIVKNDIQWAMGNRTKYGFSRQIRFKKYILAPSSKG